MTHVHIHFHRATDALPRPQPPAAPRPKAAPTPAKAPSAVLAKAGQGLRRGASAVGRVSAAALHDSRLRRL
jgi:hypothetical protein